MCCAGGFDPPTSPKKGCPPAIDEKVAEEMKKVAPGYLLAQPGAVQPEMEKVGDGDLIS